jgi:hypothetical protein
MSKFVIESFSCTLAVLEPSKAGSALNLKILGKLPRPAGTR